MGESSTESLIAYLPAALADRSPAAFSALLTDAVRWGGEQRGGSNECIGRDQAVDHYDGLLAAGITLHVAELVPDASVAGSDSLIARIVVVAPDPDDYPPQVRARLTIRDGLIDDIRILNTPPHIEILYFDGCPNHDQLLPHLHDLLAEHHIEATVSLVRIADESEARAHRFLGSPTIRVDGRDVEPAAAGRSALTMSDADEGAGYGMQCRLYATANGLTGTPQDEWILAVLIDDAPAPGLEPKRSVL